MNKESENPERAAHRKEDGAHSVFNAFAEFREPLSSMQGLLLLISYLPKSGELERYIHLLEECAGQMEEVMVKMSRFMTSYNTVRTEARLDAHDLVGNVLHTFGERIAEHAITVHTEIAQNQVWIGDHHTVSEILRQLISNSINFRNQNKSNRSIDIHVGVTPHFVRLEIKDNGTGVASQHQSKIFEPFFKASQQSKGLGIGLFLVKEMVRGLGGTLDFDSEEKVGSTFVVTIPNRLYQ